MKLKANKAMQEKRQCMTHLHLANYLASDMIKTEQEKTVHLKEQ
jgi:hypothetical protein